MRIEDVNQEPPPLGDQGPWIPLYRAIAGGTFELTVLSEHIVGVNTHYVYNRTIPCTAKTGVCVCLRGNVYPRWRGYLACWEPRFSRMCLLEVTAEAVRHCNVAVGNEALNLRGMLVKAYRLGKGKQSPVRVEMRVGPEPAEPLPPAPDVLAALMRLWSGEGKKPSA